MKERVLIEILDFGRFDVNFFIKKVIIREHYYSLLAGL